MQWEEGGSLPRSSSRSSRRGTGPPKMIKKFEFYERYGVEEYYIYDPDEWRARRLAARPATRWYKSPR